MVEKMTQLTQDEIVSNTKTVISGLESLKIEHHASIQALESSLKIVPLSQSQDDNQGLNEKSGILHKSMELIEIGIEEAKVRSSYSGYTFHSSLACHCGDTVETL
jgi:kinesin light chain